MKTSIQDEADHIEDSGEVCSTDVSESQSPDIVSKDVKFGHEKYKAVSESINEFEKKRMVYSIFASMLVCGTLYLNIASFYPIFVDEHYGDSINQTMVACALCCF